jgi:DNA repair protein RadC
MSAAAALSPRLTTRPRTRGERADFAEAVTVAERRAVQRALSIMARYLVQAPIFAGSWDVKDYVRLQIALEPVEVFAVLFLNTQHALIAFEVVARGTTTQTSVHIREIARRALELDASAVVLAHNHPSGPVQPSKSDLLLTASLSNALGYFDVRVLDHIIVSPTSAMSFADEGYLPCGDKGKRIAG